MTGVQTLESKLENKSGALAEMVPQFDRKTLRTSAELAAERITNNELRNIWFWAANVAAYENKQDGSLVYYIGGRKAFNTIAVDIGDFCSQLLQNNNYDLSSAQLGEMHNFASSGEAVAIDPSKLGLKGSDKEWRYIEINTASYKTDLNDEEKKLAAAGFGSMAPDASGTSDFDRVMTSLREAGIKTTRAYVLNPDYVKQKVPKGSAVARACWLNGYGIFGGDSRFVAYERDVGDSLNALRGVPLEKAAEGGAPDLDYTSLATLVGSPKFDPTKFAVALDSTGAGNLSQAITAYIAKTK